MIVLKHDRLGSGLENRLLQQLLLLVSPGKSGSMASHVVVLDDSLRKFTVKTTPNKPLADVLAEACTKKGVQPSQYSLKHGQKTLDLSNTIRFAGLHAGAKLSLVQASSSPAVVKVALDVPPSPRAIHQFPSNTTLWQVLRRFESGVAGGDTTRNANLNYTQRATPQTSKGGSAGAGRLCYEMPVLNVVGRELASFVDLQKTLAQIGVNSGNVAMKLSFRNTQQPLEEAMEEITRYFQHVEEPSPKPTNTEAGAHAGGPTDLKSTPAVDNAILPDDVKGAQSPAAPDAPISDTPSVSHPLPDGDEVIASSEAVQEGRDDVLSSRGASDSTIQLVDIFKAPSSSTPQAVAAMTSLREDEYEPTAAHALAHQARLGREGRNKRLASDKEIDEKQQALDDARTAVQKVIVKVIAPDQMALVFDCFQTTTLKDLYLSCRNVLENPKLTFKLLGVNKIGRREILPENDKRLIGDLGWLNKESVTMAWSENVPASVRSAPALSAQHQQSARELQVQQPQYDADGDTEMADGAQPARNEQKGKAKMSAEEKESRLKKMMGGGKLFGRK